MNDIPRRRLRKAWSMVALAAGLIIVLTVLAYLDNRSEIPRFSMALLITIGIAAVAAGAVGVGQLATVRLLADGSEALPVSYGHTYPVFAVLGLGFLLSLAARNIATPDSFGHYGFFRDDAHVDESNVRRPRYQGKQACAPCHEKELHAHQKDAHRAVQCEDCHGPGDEHVRAANVPNTPKPGFVEIKKSKDWCLTCHRQLDARPAFFPQVNWREHFKSLGVNDEKVECIQCHNPHEPLFLVQPISEARLHPLIHRCRDCHIGRVNEKMERPAEHPATFGCEYCHAEKVEDFDTRPHYDVKCNTCHLFLKESDFAGRIVLNRSSEACLLCHRTAAFRGGEGAPPTVAWPAHLEEVKADTTDPSTLCLKCHAAAVHGEPKKPEKEATP